MHKKSATEPLRPANRRRTSIGSLLPRGTQLASRRPNRAVAGRETCGKLPVSSALEQQPCRTTQTRWYAQQQPMRSHFATPEHGTRRTLKPAPTARHKSAQSRQRGPACATAQVETTCDVTAAGGFANISCHCLDECSLNRIERWPLRSLAAVAGIQTACSGDIYAWRSRPSKPGFCAVFVGWLGSPSAQPRLDAA
jgi:hypothetical protein